MSSDDSTAHVSPNRVQGELADAPLEKLLDDCHRFLITGTVRVVTPAGEGSILLRAGAVDEASWDDATGQAAVARMKTLRHGTYYLVQRLPNLDGELGDAAECRGDLAEFPLIEIMQHCEREALSCTITVISGFDRGEIIYRVGEIVGVTLNGEANQDSIVDIVHFLSGKFRIVAPPLSFDIEGWPSIREDPTAPFQISRHKELFRPRPSAPTEAADDQAEAADDQAEAADDQAEAADDQTESANDQAEAADDQAESADDQAEAADDQAESAGPPGKKGSDPPAEPPETAEEPEEIAKWSDAVKKKADTPSEPPEPEKQESAVVAVAPANMKKRSQAQDKAGSAPPAARRRKKPSSSPPPPVSAAVVKPGDDEPAGTLFPLFAMLVVVVGLAVIFWMYATGRL